MNEEIEYNSRDGELTSLNDIFSVLCENYDLKESEINEKWDVLENE